MEFAQRSSIRGRRSHPCSTPFGIIGIRTGAWLSRRLQRFACSTPFGINGIRTLSESIAIVRRLMCSTPFGIIGIRTAQSESDYVKADVRAQRLSASMEFALDLEHISDQQPGRCSTPFGIIGIRTALTAQVSMQHACAQRLSASLEFARGVCHNSVASWLSAQRLSASLEFAQCCRGHNSPTVRVLNAFRHHWNSHTLALDYLCSFDVLNAFRHHWNSHNCQATGFGSTR